MDRVTEEPIYQPFFGKKPDLNLTFDGGEAKMRGKMEARKKQLGEYVYGVIGLQWVVPAAIEGGYFDKPGMGKLEAVLREDFEVVVHTLALKNVYSTH